MQPIDLLEQIHSSPQETGMPPPNDQDSPLYRELAQTLRAKIVSGELPAGALLPTEFALADEHRVSRSTVRLALKLLNNEGLITAGRGRSGRRVRDGRRLTFKGSVSESIDRADARRVTGVDAWVTDVEEDGRDPSQTISVELVNASEEIAKRLDIKPGDIVVVRRRTRYVDGEPHNAADTYYPMDIAAGTPIMSPNDVTQGVIALMREMGYVQVRYVDELIWRMPTPDESRQLDIPIGVPVMVQSRTGYTKERPVKVTVTTWPGDRARMVYELDA